METLKPNPIFRLMPSLTDIAFVMPLLFLFTRLDGVKSMLGDGDTGWHIRTGEWILAHHQIPKVDMFSYTMPGQPWYAWEWLWDVGAAVIHSRTGLAGVALASMFVLCFTFALLYRVIVRRCGNPLLSIGLTVLAAAGSSVHWLARPHLFTLLFTVVFLYILERVRGVGESAPWRSRLVKNAGTPGITAGAGPGIQGSAAFVATPATKRQGNVRLLWVLPVLTVLWTNLHGGFLLGIVLLGAYGVGELARGVLALTKEARAAAFRNAVPYLAASAGCAAASLINPYFYHLHQHIWEYLHDPYQLQHIVEFQGTNFQNGGMEFFEMMLVLGFGSAIWYGAQRNFGEVFVLVGLAHMGVMSERNVPIFMLVAAPLVGSAAVAAVEAIRQAKLPEWIRKIAETVKAAAEEIAPIDRLWRVHLICAVALLVVALGMTVPNPGLKLNPTYDAKVYPEAALSVLRDPNLKIFTHDEWGDYLIYQLSPGGSKVFIDGRSDFYGGKFGQDFLDVINVKYDWEQKLARYNVDTILLPPDAPLATAIKESSHWHAVYDDGVAIVFRPVGAPLLSPVQNPGHGQVFSISNIDGEKDDREIVQPHAIAQDRITTNLGG